MIISFRCEETQAVYAGQVSRKLPRDIQQTARRKLFYLNNARSLIDLRVPPGNRLEVLSGDRAGQYSIRVNDQWRICFRWRDADPAAQTPAGAADVEIVDYH